MRRRKKRPKMEPMTMPFSVDGSITTARGAGGFVVVATVVVMVVVGVVVVLLVDISENEMRTRSFNTALNTILALGTSESGCGISCFKTQERHC